MKPSISLIVAALVSASLAATAGTAKDSRQVRATCTNTGEIQAKVGNCDPFSSEGLLSVFDCKVVGGTVYYCVVGGQPTCLLVSDYPNETIGGECFQPPQF